ncbi:hypothetical protein IC575_029333 [Cucumis melo]
MAASTFVFSITTLSLLVLALINHPPLAFAQPRFSRYVCVEYTINNHTTDGAAYKANLNHLLTTLTTDHHIDYGFYNSSYGAGENRANVIGLCRGNISPETCRKCLNDSRDLLPVRCPTHKEAIGWYQDCMLRYSDRPILGSMELSPSIPMGYPFNASDPERFTQAARKLIESLIAKASAGDSHVKFSTGNTTLADFPTIYAFAQCTPDLSRRQCNECLTEALAIIQDCCVGNLFGRVATPSCLFRYGDDSLIQWPTSPWLSSSPSPVSSLLNRTTHHGNKSSLSRTFIPVIVPMAVVVLLLTITIYMGQRKYSPTTRGEECMLIKLVFLFFKLNQPLEMDLKFPSTIIPCFEATGQTEEEMARMGFMQYDFDTIRIGTDKFSDENKVGEGGFGAVYKGKLPNGRIVAVKRLSQASRQGDVEFKNEVVLLSKLRHRNLVKLLGFSFKENEELLIYEFLQNASLQKFIFGGLDWTTRYKIIEGITRGLVYLHEDSRIKIVHQNLKAHNILLDAEMNAKISDSGIARLFALEQTQDDTCTIIDNVGCMAPEYIRYGHLSSKSNVFSYGVLVLEIVTGHKENYQTARRNWREGRTLLNIVDPTIEIQSETTMNEVTKCIHIGLLCTQEDVDERPKMTDVLLMLKSDLADFPKPSQPSFFMNTIS